MKTIIINMHPKPSESVRCSAVIKRLSSLPHVTVRNIAETFKPGCKESVTAEQEILTCFSRIVFLYPVYWYGFPAVGKAYLDEVFSYGFAFVAGDSRFGKLKDKAFKIVGTTGGPAAAYENNPVLSAVAQGIARYAGMKYEDAFLYFSNDDESKLDALARQLEMTTLVLNMHPKPEQSARCKMVVEKLQKLHNVTVRDAVAKYHRGAAGAVQAEQAELLKHKHIVMVFPVYWFAMPGEAKIYLDDVFSQGFAYQYGATSFAKLEHKHLHVYMTTGGSAADYPSVDAMTSVFKEIAGFTGMVFHDPTVLFMDDDEKKLSKIAAEFE